MEALLYLHFDVQGELRKAAEDCEEAVFLQAFGNTKSQLNSEYETYNEQSIFLAVADAEGYVYGACRLITPGPAGLKTLNDVAREPWGVDGGRSARAAGVDPADAWDIATLGVREELRGTRVMVSMALYHGILVASRVNDVTWATAIMDEHARRVLTMAGYVMPALPGTAPAPYLGSPSSTPMYGHFANVMDAQRRLNPDAYRLMTMGIGLDGISVPERSEFALKPAPVRVRAAQRWGVLTTAGAA
jgi:hypothetical protein